MSSLEEQTDILKELYSSETSEVVQPHFEYIKTNADNILSIISVANDKATLDSLYADKATLDGLFAIKNKIDSLFADKATLDSLHTEKTGLQLIYNNLLIISSVADNILSIQNTEQNADDAEVFKNQAEVFKNQAEVFKNQAEVFKNQAEDISGGTVYADNVEFADSTKLDSYRTNTDSALQAINTILLSDDTTLDELQEIVTYIKQNRSDLQALGISNIAGLQTSLNLKANTSTTYSKTEVENSLSSKADITYVDNKLDTKLSKVASSVLINQDSLAITGSTLTITDGEFTYTDGRTNGGYNVSGETVTGTIDFTGVSDGYKWIARDKTGSYSFYDTKPTFDLDTGLYDGETETLSFIPYAIDVQSETPQTFNYSDKLVDNVMTDLKVGMVEANNLLGQSQTWQDVTASRSPNVTYTNSTGRPILVSVVSSVNCTLHIGAVGQLVFTYTQLAMIVPNGSTYKLDGTHYQWFELR